MTPTALQAQLATNRARARRQAELDAAFERGCEAMAAYIEAGHYWYQDGHYCLNPEAEYAIREWATLPQGAAARAERLRDWAHIENPRPVAEEA